MIVTDAGAPLSAGPGCTVGPRRQRELLERPGSAVREHRCGRRRPRRLGQRRRGRPGDDSRRRRRRPHHGRRRRRQPDRRLAAPTSPTAAAATTRSTCATGSRTAPGAAAAATACAPRRSTRSTWRCERVDYGPPGQVGRPCASRAAGASCRSPARPGRASTGASCRRALPGPPLPRAHHRGLRDHRPRALRRAPARPGRGHRAGPGRHLGRRGPARPLGRAAPEPPALPVPLGRLERRLQPRPPVGLQALAAAARRTCTCRGRTRRRRRGARRARCGSSRCAERQH